MRNYLRALKLMLDLVGDLVLTTILALTGAIVLLLVSPALAAILDADELESLLNR